MSAQDPIWITEAEVVDLIDLPGAIDALEQGLLLQANGSARNMSKTHVTWGEGDTLHAIGAIYENPGVVGAKVWAHTAGGATPLLAVWDSRSGALLAMIEAFALGQMRTGGMSGVATRWMASPSADVFAMIGTGKQALAQLAAVAAVRQLKAVRIWGRDGVKRDAFARAVQGLGYNFAIETPDSIEAAADGAAVVTLATRAKDAFFTGAMAASGVHINAIGAITPEREEFGQDVLDRAELIAADDVAAARRLSRELQRGFGADEALWARVRPLSELVLRGVGRPAGQDLSIFKAMGMGIADLALGQVIYQQALAKGLGRAFSAPKRVPPRLTATNPAMETSR